MKGLRCEYHTLFSNRGFKFWLLPAIIFIIPSMMIIGLIISGGEKKIVTNEIQMLVYESPLEKNRCYSKKGFSIIKPQGWVTGLVNDIEDDEILENGYYLLSSKGRTPHSIIISRKPFGKEEQNGVEDVVQNYLKKNLHLSHYESMVIQFQENEAYLFMESEKVYSKKKKREQSYFCVAFVKNQYLYLFQVIIIGDCSKMPSGILKFINTFQSKSCPCPCPIVLSRPEND